MSKAKYCKSVNPHPFACAMISKMCGSKWHRPASPFGAAISFTRLRSLRSMTAANGSSSFSTFGYWNNPEASHAAFVSGYWRSGDVGSIDALGRMRLLDRIKDMINRGGYKVYCVELETVIQRYPGVVEVVAVSSPCRVLGERVQVFLHANQ